MDVIMFFDNPGLYAVLTRMPPSLPFDADTIRRFHHHQA